MVIEHKVELLFFFFTACMPVAHDELLRGRGAREVGGWIDVVLCDVVFTSSLISDLLLARCGAFVRSARLEKRR